MVQKRLVFLAPPKQYKDYIRKNAEFHQLIGHLSGNNNLEKIITELRARIYRYRLISVTISGYIEKYVSDHEKIINVMEKGDSSRARKYMEEHVDFVKDILVNFLKISLGF